ncbi:TetR/AcrR family transcriptional regulator [Neobacillus massiliamazoniensis]|uniref:TetR family transcriptional regulator n=1 Tax=Neobacillus massiliamazoniensis TaxID=1499688 RepID=A0A0U1P4H4_9BACI|nr:TetR/AcrR family transcriptional regulator [Neobacillus massiliamazoniensis]CRK85116.1 TetR family transcriptional regulator [Neobacillus massiliamazoniensis]
MASFREDRSAERKLIILRTAAHLFIQKGYHATTIEDIANELRMTKGAIYYYVNSKEDLLFQCHTLVAAKCIERLQEIIEEKNPQAIKLEKAINSLVLYVIEENAVFNIINRNSVLSKELYNKVIEQRDYYEDLFESILVEGINDGSFQTDNIKLTKLLILGSINSISTWYKPRDSMLNEDIANFYSKSLIKILGVKPPHLD